MSQTRQTCRSRFKGAACLILTVFVMLICFRIEWLNVQCGGILPRHVSGLGNLKWRLAARRSVRKTVEREIALRRHEEWIRNHPGETAPERELLSQSSYSREELKLFEDALHKNTLEHRLHSWVSGPGLLQYFLAPAAFIWSLILIFRSSGPGRILGAVTGICSLLAVALMFHRAYFASLGF